MRQSIKTNGCLSEFELVDIPDGMFGRGGCVLKQLRVGDVVELKAINGNTIDARRLCEETPWGEFNFCAGKSAARSPRCDSSMAAARAVTRSGVA